MWFIGVEVDQETSAPPPKKNPGSAPEYGELVLGEFGTSAKYTSTESGAHRWCNTAGRLGTF